MSKLENAFKPTLPCPHCNHNIEATLIRGFHGIKQCPSCQKKIKFKKPAFGDIIKSTWKSFLIFLICITGVAAFFVFFLGKTDVPSYVFMPIVVAYLLFFQMPVVNQLSSFEKDE